MKIKLLTSFGLVLLFAGLAQGQETPLDCTKNLNPRTAYGDLLIGCPSMASTPNNIAATAIEKTRFLPSPTVKQCQADLASWEQAGADWYAQEQKRYAQSTPPKMSENPRPVTLLSTEELYRRSNQMESCTSSLIGERQRVWKAGKADKDKGAVWNTLDALAIQVDESRQAHEEFLKEQLLRAEAVIDKHLLWDGLRNP